MLYLEDYLESEYLYLTNNFGLIGVCCPFNVYLFVDCVAPAASLARLAR